MTASVGELHLLRYVPGTSPVHRLWAGTKLLAVDAVGVAVVSRPTWRAEAVAAAVLLVALALARVPAGAVPRPPKWFAYALGLGAVVALAAGGSPSVDVGGGVALGFGGLLDWLRFTTIGVIVFGMATVLGWTTPIADLAPAISRLLTPLRWVRFPVDELVAAITLCVRSLPLLIDEMRTLYAVRRLRQQTMPHSTISFLVDLLVTALVSSLRRGRELADAIEARGGIGPAPRLPVRFRAADAAALVAAAGATAAILVV
jgi:energy-coupling factor transporter transmembrane protein EcfT